MKGIGLVVAGAVACALVGCEDPAAPHGDPGRRIDATVLAMDADGPAPGRYAALSDSPIHLGAFTSWYGRGADGENFDEVTDDVPPGSVFLAYTGNTACRVPEGVQVSRDGDDLEVLFVGGADREECVRAVGPGVYLALPADAVEGVRTANGEPLRDPAGPGKAVDFVPLGGERFGPVPPAEFGTPALDVLRTALLTARQDDAQRLRSALGRPVPRGERMFAFVVSGCAVEEAVLVSGPDHITAAPIRSGEPVVCDAPEYYLSTFVVDADDVPADATLSD